MQSPFKATREWERMVWPIRFGFRRSSTNQKARLGLKPRWRLRGSCPTVDCHVRLAGKHNTLQWSSQMKNNLNCDLLVIGFCFERILEKAARCLCLAVMDSLRESYDLIWTEWLMYCKKPDDTMQDQVYIPVPLCYQKSDATPNVLKLVPETMATKISHKV